MAAKILPVISEDGEPLHNQRGDVIYQVIEEPHQGLRGSIEELTEQIGPVHWQEAAFVLDKKGWIVEPGFAASFNPLGTLGMLHQKGQRQRDQDFITHLGQADTLDELLGPEE